MVRVSQLRKLNPAAWTRLLAQKAEMGDIQVNAVQAESLDGSRKLARYWLSLDGHHEATTLIGKLTNAVEARFYSELAPGLPRMVPHCWFSHVDGDKSWIVLDEVSNHRPPQSWTADEIDSIVGNLAAVHATHWGKIRQLAEWQDHFLSPRRFRRAPEERPAAGQKQRHPLVSDHAIRTAGSLAPLLIKAASGLQLIRRLGGWPQVLDETQLQAAAELLDDPLPMLQPLRELPVTLLHGRLSPYNWRLDLFDRSYLLNWQSAGLGPAVWDLVTFLEQIDLLEDDALGWRCRQELPVSEETMIDSYMLAMWNRLGNRFPARTVRQAIPAARCLYILTTWFPRFVDWFQFGALDRENWQRLNKMDDRQLLESGFSQMVGLRPHLNATFRRLRRACQML